MPEEKICPILNIALTKDQMQGSAISCQKEKCALWKVRDTSFQERQDSIVHTFCECGLIK